VVSQIVAAVILVFVSYFVLLMSYVLGVCKEFSLIAGMDTSKVRDGDGLARRVGTGLLGIGALDLLISLAGLAIPAATPHLTVAYVAVSLGGAVVLLVRVRRYFG